MWTFFVQNNSNNYNYAKWPKTTSSGNSFAKTDFTGELNQIYENTRKVRFRLGLG